MSVLKIIVVSGLAVLAFGSVAEAGSFVLPYTPDADTAVLYHFDESTGTTVASDSSVGGLNLTAASSPFTGLAGPDYLAGAGGLFNDAARVPALTLNAAGIARFNVETFTIEAWVRNPGLDGHDQIFGYRHGNNSRVSLRVAGGGSLGLAFQKAADGGYLQVSGPAVSWETDKWYHVAVTYEGNGSGDDSVVNFYRTPLDDTSGTAGLLGTITGVNDIMPLTVNGFLRLGGVDGMLSRSFDGTIDEVRYYNAALAANQFNLPIPEPASILLFLLGILPLALLRRRASR